MPASPLVMPPAAAGPIELTGSAFDRGLAQARRCPGSRAAVRDAVSRRLDPVRDALARTAAASYLARQWDFAAEHDPDALAEVEGIAAGYGLGARELFAALHAGMLVDAGAAADGCSAWAAPHGQFGALLAKNRDLHAAFQPVQRVFRHRDAGWQGRTVLCVGSLGSPGVYSSGINSDGLALADTQIRTSDHGVGLLRYFAMTRVLARCATVDEALDELRAVRHAGGGSLVLADGGGRVAAVELGHRTVAVERPASGTAGRVARTNHFVSAALRDQQAADDAHRAGSDGRLRLLRGWLDGLAGDPDLEGAAAVMASHDEGETTGLCRHGGPAGSTTISTSVFACRGRTLWYSAANPCAGEWTVYACAGADGGEG
jgi:isopenicillin-N N-acyltransferase-like protein